MWSVLFFWLNKLASAAAGFRSSSSGQITFSLALVSVPLILTIGSAIDYGMLLRARSSLQQALDSATLAAAAKDGTLNPQTARSYFVLNGTLSGVTLGRIDFTKTSDGTVIGTATASVPAVFMKIVRKGDFNVRLTSKANGVPESKQRNLIGVHSAKGIYDIEIYFYAQNAAGAITNRMLFMTYDYSLDPKTGKGTSSLTKNPNIGNFTVPLGSIYGTMLIVYLDTSGRGQRINPDVLRSEAPEAERRFYVKTTGDCWSSSAMTFFWEVTRDPFGDYRDAVTRWRAGW